MVMGKESVVDSKGFFCLGFHTWFGRLMQPKKVSREESPGTSQKVEYLGLQIIVGWCGNLKIPLGANLPSAQGIPSETF